MKHSKFIAGLLSGVGVSLLIVAFNKKFKNRQEGGGDKTGFTYHDETKSHARNHLRKAMDKANHIKQEHKTSPL